MIFRSSFSASIGLDERIKISFSSCQWMIFTKLLTPYCSSGENTRSWLAGHAFFTFSCCCCFFFILYPISTGSFELFLWSCTFQAGLFAKNTWKSSAAAVREISKGEFSCLTRKSNTLFVSKAKNLDWICLVEKLKSVMATNCFHLATSSNER